MLTRMSQALTEVAEQERELKDLVAGILDEARRQGASAAEVSVSEDEGLTVSVRQRDLETVEFNRDRGFGITVYVGDRKGSASTSDASPEAVRTLVWQRVGQPADEVAFAEQLAEQQVRDWQIEHVLPLIVQAWQSPE